MDKIHNTIDQKHTMPSIMSKLPNDIIIKIVKETFQIQFPKLLKEYQTQHQKKFCGILDQIDKIYTLSRNGWGYDGEWPCFEFDDDVQSYYIDVPHWEDRDYWTRDNYFDYGNGYSLNIYMWIDGKTDIIKPSNVKWFVH